MYPPDRSHAREAETHRKIAEAGGITAAQCRQRVDDRPPELVALVTHLEQPPATTLGELRTTRKLVAYYRRRAERIRMWGA